MVFYILFWSDIFSTYFVNSVQSIIQLTACTTKINLKWITLFWIDIKLFYNFINLFQFVIQLNVPHPFPISLHFVNLYFSFYSWFTCIENCTVGSCVLQFGVYRVDAGVSVNILCESLSRVKYLANQISSLLQKQKATMLYHQFQDCFPSSEEIVFFRSIRSTSSFGSMICSKYNDYVQT